MIYQWTSLGLGLMVKKDNVPRPYITYLWIKVRIARFEIIVFLVALCITRL
jgi:hypothetical protein